MFIYFLYFLFVTRGKCCSDNFSKSLFVFYAAAIFIGFFSYTSVMSQEIVDDDNNALTIFIVLMLFCFDAAISCICIGSGDNSVPQNRRPLLNI